MIVLSDQEVKELQDYFLEMPGKYGISMINFFNGKIAEAQQLKQLTENSNNTDGELKNVLEDIEVNEPEKVFPKKRRR